MLQRTQSECSLTLQQQFSYSSTFKNNINVIRFLRGKVSHYAANEGDKPIFPSNTFTFFLSFFLSFYSFLITAIMSCTNSFIQQHTELPGKKKKTTPLVQFIDFDAPGVH